MTLAGILQIVLLMAALVLLAKPLGLYMARVFEGDKTLFDPLFLPVQKWIYRFIGINEKEDMRWTTYSFALLAFSITGMILSYCLLRLQGLFPFNPQHYGAKQMPPDLAFNTAISFLTNTNWQSYSPEASVSYFSNMVALAAHNWMSAASGMAVAVALIRGIARRSSKGIGNFWVDITRTTLYILLPLCLVFAMVLVWQGVPQNFHPYTQAITLQGNIQTIAQGPVASQEAIKELGTNGGGFFNANSAHPYENPTPLSNFLEILAILLIPVGLTITFGKMTGSIRQGWVLFAAMSILFLLGAFFCYRFEQSGNPMVARIGVQEKASNSQPGGNMEGKETRFGIPGSTLFAVATTDTSCGAVNSMHDSYTPLGGMIPLLNLLSGEVIFGGVGSGLFGILMYVILAVFIAGLMVGRTPEFMGKKIEQFEVKMAMLAVLVLAASILGFTALSSNMNLPSTSVWNQVHGGSPSQHLGATWKNVTQAGPHGFSEIFYAFASTTGNNGSAFAGLNSNTPYYNLTLALAMLIGRFLLIIPLLAIAGSLASKKYLPPSSGTFPTDTATFAMLLDGVVVIVGALTFIPALALGPIVEHLQMMAGLLH
jgi:K+-transporting ATPase ATPase A chain